MKQTTAATFFPMILATLAAAVLCLSPECFARGHNPAVSNQFFENMQAVAGDCSKPAAQAVLVTGSVNRVSWQQLACQIQSMATAAQPRPMVIEVTTSDPNMCDQYKNDAQAASDICQRQLTESDGAAQARPDVLFVSVDATQYPGVLSGVDVRVLPSHILINSYHDTAHYEAIKIFGFLDSLALTGAVASVFTAAP